MLAFSIDYYGIFFWATQFVELFCTYIVLISWYDRDDKKDCMQKIVTEKDKGDWKNV